MIIQSGKDNSNTHSEEAGKRENRKFKYEISMLRFNPLVESFSRSYKWKHKQQCLKSTSKRGNMEISSKFYVLHGRDARISAQ